MPAPHSKEGSPDLRAFYLSYVAAANARDMDLIASLYHDEVLINGVPRTRDDAVRGFKETIDAVPDFHWNLEDLVIEGDRIASKLRDTGTPVKEWFGLPPNGRSVDFTELCHYRVQDGRFAEAWFMMDYLTVADQLGG